MAGVDAGGGERSEGILVEVEGVLGLGTAVLCCARA